MLIPCLDHPTYFHFVQKKKRRNSTITESTGLRAETTPAKRRNVFLLKLKKKKFWAKEEPRQALQWLYQCFLSWWTKSLILMVCDKYTTSTEWGTYHPLFLMNHVSQKLWIFCSFLDSSEMLKPWYKYLPQSPGPNIPPLPPGVPRVSLAWETTGESGDFPAFDPCGDWRIDFALNGDPTPGEWSFRWASRIRFKQRKQEDSGRFTRFFKSWPTWYFGHTHINIYIYIFFLWAFLRRMLLVTSIF